MSYEVLTPILVERFWSYVQKNEGGCWIWTSTRDKDGYGMFRVGAKKRRAHRVSLELAGRAVPEGLVPDHLCRVTSCVNPDHLEIVTGRDNNLRGTGPAAINATKTHCQCGQLFVAVKSGRYRRICSACRAKAERARRARRRADGRCIVCGAEATASRCERCLARRNEQQKARRRDAAVLV